MKNHLWKLLGLRKEKKIEKGATNDQLTLVREYKQKFIYTGSNLLAAGDAQTTFITLAALQRALSRDDIEKLLRFSPDYQKSSLEPIYTRLLRIIGVLIEIEWCNWEAFPRLFFDKNKRDVLADRTDRALPFENLSFLEPQPYQSLFQHHQFTFAPVLIIEDIFREYSSSYRLPFEACDLHTGGGYGNVYKVLIPKYCIRYTRGAAAGNRNDRKQLMARKISKEGRTSLEDENKIQEIFRAGSAKSECILLSFARFLHGSTLNILYPWADLDLWTFLHGEYVGFSKRAEKFTAYLILEQMMHLAGGLHFIHQELFPNQPIQCAHLDFKPENILVFWPGDGLYEDRRAKMPVRKPTVGLWKITDFGISRTRPEPRPQVHSLYPTDTVGSTTREHSSMAATRDAGPFQPPEARKEGRVSWSTDMWSFGCVAVLVLAFILGGPEKVIELDRQRTCHGNDYFWTTDISNLDIVKPEIHRWLNDQQQSSTPWIQQYINIIQSLLQIDRKSRSKASVVRGALQKVWELTENIPSLWSPRSDDIYLKRASVRIAEPDGREISPVSFPASSNGDIEDDNTPSHTPSPQIMPPVSTSTGGVRSLGIELTTHPRRSAEIVRPGPSLARLSQPLRTWPAAPNQTWYARLSTPQDTIQAMLSADAKTLAFYSKDHAYIYDLQKILDLSLFWQEMPGQKSMQLLKDGLKIYHCPVGRTLTSVLAAGPFVAFQSKSTHIDELDFLDIHNSVHESVEEEVGATSMTILIPKECMNTKISSKGAVLLIFKSRLVLYINQQPTEAGAFASSHTIQAASFSKNGEYLCVWYKTLNNSNCWCIYKIGRTKAKRISYQRTDPICAPELGKPLRSPVQVLIPFNNHSRFIACDHHGRIHLLRADGPEKPEACKGEVNGAYAGVTLPNDSMLLILCSVTGRQYSTVDLGIVLHENDQQSVELCSSWTQLERPFHAPRGSDQCGVSTFAEGFHYTLLTAFLDGCVVRQVFKG